MEDVEPRIFCVEANTLIRRLTRARDRADAADNARLGTVYQRAINELVKVWVTLDNEAARQARGED